MLADTRPLALTRPGAGSRTGATAVLQTLRALQHAVRANSFETYENYAEQINEQDKKKETKEALKKQWKEIELPEILGRIKPTKIAEVVITPEPTPPPTPTSA